MNINVSYTPTFERQFKKYWKKFLSIETDLKSFISDIEKLPKIHLGGDFYKYRLAVKSKNTGKRGGFRIVTFEVVVSQDLKNATLVIIYDKSETDSIPLANIRNILESENFL